MNPLLTEEPPLDAPADEPTAEPLVEDPALVEAASDTDAADDTASDDEPAATVIKHTNPCGAAIGSSAADAYLRLRDTLRFRLDMHRELS